MERPSPPADRRDDEPAPFDLAGALAGARQTLPVGASVFAYGLVFGVLARQAGLSPAEALLMSAIVFAGSSQFVALDLWVTPLPVASLVVTTLVVNLRHLLMGAALDPLLGRLPARRAYSALFLLNDESWALTMGEQARGRRNAAFLLGSGLVAWLAWTGATLAGGTLGGALRDPARWGLDFAFTAVFVALLAGFWRGKSDLLPWAVAAIAAVAADRWLAGTWHILLGGLAGSLVAALGRSGGETDVD